MAIVTTAYDGRDARNRQLAEIVFQNLGSYREIGDGVNQAADLISATVSIPSLNFIPLTTFGNWF